MVAWYSDVFHSTGVGSTTTSRTPGYACPPGRQQGPCKVSRINLTGVTTMVDTDVLVMQPIQPNDRIRALFLSTDNVFNGSVTLTIDVGLWRLDAAGNLGTVIDANLFTNDLSIDATAIGRTDVFQLATSNLTQTDRMKRAWELANVGGTSFTKGPNELWVIGFLFNLSGTVTGGIAQLEAEIYDG